MALYALVLSSTITTTTSLKRNSNNNNKEDESVERRAPYKTLRVGIFSKSRPGVQETAEE
jgi:hypothetical protein